MSQEVWTAMVCHLIYMTQLFYVCLAAHCFDVSSWLLNLLWRGCTMRLADAIAKFDNIQWDRQYACFMQVCYTFSVAGAVLKLMFSILHESVGLMAFSQASLSLFEFCCDHLVF